MKEPISLSIFFPTYNEEENIVPAVEQAIDVVESSPFIGNYEILIIDDGSSDHTKELSLHLQSLYPNVRLISHAKNRGYGAALKTGLRSATKDYIFFTDADLQFDIAELQNLIIHSDKYDVIAGYRAPRRDPLMRLLNAFGWNVLNRLLFGLRIRDIDCAFKVFKRDLIQNMKLHSRGAMINAEILIKLRRMGVEIKEVPVSHLPRLRGSPTGAKPSVILRAFREMITLYGGELGSLTHKQALKFMGVGVVNTLLDLMAYVALTRGTFFFSEHVVAAKLLSFLVGTVSSLVLNRYWTFGLRTRLQFAEIIRFYTIVSLSLLINVEGMNALISLHVYDLLALLLTTGGTFMVGFILSKFWIFRPQETTKEPNLARL